MHCLATLQVVGNTNSGAIMALKHGHRRLHLYHHAAGRRTVIDDVRNATTYSLLGSQHESVLSDFQGELPILSYGHKPGVGYNKFRDEVRFMQG